MKNKKIIIGLFATLLLLVIFPVITYFFNFHGKFSKNPADWASFGSFVSGTSGTILSALSIIALIYTLYITVRNNERSNQLTLKALDNAEKQLKNMEREFSIKIFETHIEVYNTAIDSKEFSLPKKGKVSRKIFLDEAYKRLTIEIWCRLSNNIPENVRGFDFYLPASILSDLKNSFADEFRHFLYIIDMLYKTDDEITFNTMNRIYLSKLDQDILFFICCYTYAYQTQFRHILSDNNNQLLVLSERAARAIQKAHDLVEKGKTPWEEQNE
ncbi:TPA: hypothetical protein ACGW1T_003335 [Raoultella ornithinolytica]